MRVVESQWWIIDLPEEWEAEQIDDVITIGDEDGVGVIEFTTLQKEEGLVDESELREFTADTEQQFGAGQKIQVADLHGYYYCYREEGEAVREWYLRSGDLMLFIIYSCDDENAGMDDGAVDEILSTLFIKPQEASDQE